MLLTTLRAWVQYSHMKKPLIWWFQVISSVALTALLIYKIVFIALAGTSKFIIEITPLIGLIIAIVAANIAISSLRKTEESLKLTRESLELTRNTQRPFLSVSEANYHRYSDNLYIFDLTIKNTGTLPAKDVHADFQFFDSSEKIGKQGNSSKYALTESRGNPIPLFPNNSYTSQTYLDSNDDEDKQIIQGIENSKVKIRVIVNYGSTSKNYKTIQTQEVTREGGLITFRPGKLQDWT